MSSNLTSLKDRVRALSLAGILAAVPLYSCGSSQAVQKSIDDSVKQTVRVDSPVEQVQVIIQKAEEPEGCNPDVEAGRYLQQGFGYAQTNDVPKMVRSFECAVSTGNLNLAGSALAYWHVAVGYQNLGQVDEACDAFNAFILYASDILEQVSGASSAGRPDDFVTSFSLESKLDMARATLNSEWVKRTDMMGRSADNPVPVYNEHEMQLFFGYLHDCYFKSFDSEPISEGSSTEKVTYECRDDGFTAEYYFDFLKR